MTLRVQQFEKNDRGDVLTSFASDLGMPVGQWPGQIELDCSNGVQHYELIGLNDESARYANAIRTSRLVIFND